MKAVDAQIISFTELVVELPGLFTLYPKRSVFDFPCSVSPALTIVQAQTADNRLLTAARALDSRVTPRVEEVCFQLRQPGVPLDHHPWLRERWKSLDLSRSRPIFRSLPKTAKKRQ